MQVGAQTRSRRPPVDVLSDLQAKRADLAQRLGARLAKLDARIEKLEARYELQIELAALTNGMTADELIMQLEETRNLQKLLRMAMKTTG